MDRKNLKQGDCEEPREIARDGEPVKLKKKNTYTNKTQKIKATEETRRDQGIVVARV